jgi:hypothetical protein
MFRWHQIEQPQADRRGQCASALDFDAQRHQVTVHWAVTGGGARSVCSTTQ